MTVPGSLFPLDHPNRCWVQAHLDGRMDAEVTAFPPDGPASTWLVRFGTMFVFAGGDVTEAALQDIVDHLGPGNGASVVVPRDVRLAEMRLPQGYRAARRCHHRVSAGRLLRTLTAEAEDRQVAAVVDQGFDVRPIAADDLEEPLLRDTMLRIYGSAEGFGGHELLGHCATKDGALVSWLHPVVGGRVGEVGSLTHPDFRGRGLIPALVYRTARQLAAHGYDMTASWDPDHQITPRHGVLVALEHEFDYAVLAPATS